MNRIEFQGARCTVGGKWLLNGEHPWASGDYRIKAAEIKCLTLHLSVHIMIILWIYKKLLPHSYELRTEMELIKVGKSKPPLHSSHTNKKEVKS